MLHHDISSNESHRAITRKLQEAVKSNCGSSFWSCCRTRRTSVASHGRERTENSNWSTQTRSPDAGEKGRASLTWTTTSSVVPWGTTTTKISWPRFTAKGTPTNSTSLVSPKLCNQTPSNHRPPKSTRGRTTFYSLATMPVRPTAT